jgi:predicted MFS family arabinose efflux permease
MIRPRFVLLFLVAFLVGADEFLLGPILTPIGRDLGVPPERVVLFVAAYSLPLAVLAPFFGALSDRRGRLAVLVPACVVFAAASVATALAPSFETGLLSRVVTGAASAGMLPIALAMAADHGEGRAAEGIAFVQSGLTLGIVLSPGIGALAAEFASWRVAFGGLGLAALPVAALAWQGRASAPARPAAGAAPRGPVLVPGAVGSVAAMALGLGGAVGIFALVGERLRDAFALDTGTIGLVYAAFGLATVCGNFLMPVAERRLGGGRRVMRLALLAVLAAIVVVYAADAAGPWLVGIALASWAVLGGVGAPALQNHIASLSPARRGALLALGMSALNLGVAASSGLAGHAYAQGAPWVAGLGVLLLSAAVFALRPAATREKCVA